METGSSNHLFQRTKFECLVLLSLPGNFVELLRVLHENDNHLELGILQQTVLRMFKLELAPLTLQKVVRQKNYCSPALFNAVQDVMGYEAADTAGGNNDIAVHLHSHVGTLQNDTGTFFIEMKYVPEISVVNTQSELFFVVFQKGHQVVFDKLNVL